jgi:hypothetical protein
LEEEEEEGAKEEEEKEVEEEVVEEEEAALSSRLWPWPGEEGVSGTVEVAARSRVVAARAREACLALVLVSTARATHARKTSGVNKCFFLANRKTITRYPVPCMYSKFAVCPLQNTLTSSNTTHKAVGESATSNKGNRICGPAIPNTLSEILSGFISAPSPKTTPHCARASSHRCPMVLTKR